MRWTPADREAVARMVAAEVGASPIDRPTIEGWMKTEIGALYLYADLRGRWWLRTMGGRQPAEGTRHTGRGWRERTAVDITAAIRAAQETDLPDLTPDDLALLQRGGWTLVPGMAALNADGDRCRVSHEDEAVVWRRADGWWTAAAQAGPFADLAPATPDPADPATRALMLAELARRVGLDPEWGVGWQPVYGPADVLVGWSLSRGLWSTESVVFAADAELASRFRGQHVPGIDTLDPLRALLLAGVATARKESDHV